MQSLEKRTYDNRPYDLNCTDLLDAVETIASVVSITADQGSLVFGLSVVNTSLVTYPDGTTAATGKAIQVGISAGTIPAGYVDLVCTIRAKFLTNLGAAIEATVRMRLIDYPTT